MWEDIYMDNSEAPDPHYEAMIEAQAEALWWESEPHRHTDEDIARWEAPDEEPEPEALYDPDAIREG